MRDFLVECQLHCKALKIGTSWTNSSMAVMSVLSLATLLTLFTLSNVVFAYQVFAFWFLPS